MIYKFRPVESNDGLRSYERDLLTKGELFLSKPSSFNDLFDSQFEFEPPENTSDEDIRKWAEFILKHNPEKEGECLEFINNPDLARTIARESFTELDWSDLVYINCFCKKITNPAMWGYYASNCRGFAVGFETISFANNKWIRVIPNSFYNNADDRLGILEQMNLGCVPLIEMIYSDSKPKPINFFNIRPGQQGEKNYERALEFVFTKASVWSNEKEIRLSIPDSYLLDDGDKKVNKIQVESGVIKEIILGIKAPERLKDEILALVKCPENKCYGARVYHLEKDFEKYEYRKGDELTVPKCPHMYSNGILTNSQKP